MAEPKPGKSTSELWVTVIAGILVLVNKKIGLDLQADAITALAGLIAAYTVGRSVVKITNKTGT